MTWKTAVLDNYFNISTISGRTARNDFWYLMFFNLIICFCVVNIYFLFPNFHSWLFDQDGRTDFFYFLCFVALFSALSIFSALVRRLHDVNHSGKWVLILILVPVIIYLAFRNYSELTLDQRKYFDLSSTVIIGLWISLFLYIIFISTLRGHEGINRFGHDPLKLNEEKEHKISKNSAKKEDDDDD